MSDLPVQENPRPAGDLGLLRAVACLLFVGHAWTHLQGRMPISALLWDEGLFRGIAEDVFGRPWDEWVSDPSVERGMGVVSRLFGLFYAGCALLCLRPPRGRWVMSAAMVAASLSLFFLAWLKYRDSVVGIGQWLEHCGQFCTPLVLALALAGRLRATDVVARVAIAFTFVFHGLFAIGVPSEIAWLDHPTPARFVEMTMLCLGIETESTALLLLKVAGVLDQVVALIVLLPLIGGERRWRGAQLTALGYMVAWGFLTAMARPWANFDATTWLSSLVRWLPEMLYRTPHWGLALWLGWRLWRTAARVRSRDAKTEAPDGDEGAMA